MTHSLESYAQDAERAVLGSVEAKVKSSATAATLTAAVLSALGDLVFHGGVPGAVAAIVGTVVTGALTFVSGWLTKHTPAASSTVAAPVVNVVAAQPAPQPSASAAAPVAAPVGPVTDPSSDPSLGQSGGTGMAG